MASHRRYWTLWWGRALLHCGQSERTYQVQGLPGKAVQAPVSMSWSYWQKAPNKRHTWTYKLLSQSCAVAKREQFWRATGQSNLADRMENCSIGQSAVVWVRKPHFGSFCWVHAPATCLPIFTGLLLKRRMGNGEWGMRFLTYIDVEMPHLCYICRFNVRTNLGPNPRRWG